ncbi:GlxA family transcriptional regulator [Promicromonospora thailandica]|uniref:Transcriptional regulator GlxA family, contains an amidase domain and an AraC-type DNA-binding HTH domain n=1 Tax=Promicromonospora thailandica TaxID=765201 RepID=A0A9X2G042_9MICO|nr:helix-turn-helix domain-containing protein [Promicromonospora thailandica]MCP2264580.1 Transcriptional regulator GlxA family, contains an amidase domain and an AraC-type DNA-binding HTH domain [Promicromonospora thailandica]BFF20352.1 helix-turn-helix domain-containing protein [Promicromonospora thailandica]
MHTVAVLALPDTIIFDLATPVEVFGRARLPDGRPAYQVIVCGTEPVVDAGPIRIGTDVGLEGLARADTVVVPGRERPQEPVPEPALAALRAAAADGTRLASICVGAFTLAQAGLLDGLRATTHWLAADALAAQYPAVDVDPESLYIDNGQVLTSAGAAAGLDLCLHLVRRDHGVAVAADAARLSVTPLHRDGGQAQFILRNPPTLRTATLEPVLRWIEENAHADLALADVAAAARTSVRTLNRRFHEETGQSPMQWLTGVRIRHAQELLETTDYGVERIARQVGFPSPSTFRELFRRATGVTPRGYRVTFRGRPEGSAA